MHKTATIVHLDSIDGVEPLVGAYLKAFALADPEVRASWDIELFTRSTRAKASQLMRHLARRRPDLVAFSTYTWNAGLVMRVLPALRELLPPTTHYLLGGVEVTNVAPRYVRPEWEDVTVCNGEGERSFHRLLLELTQERPDLTRVAGVTFVRDGAWITTEGPPRIEDLTELPSPWLSGVLDDVPPGTVALLETNRGCPFRCEFCFWGGAIGQKVYRQDVDRVRDELTYIAKRGVGTINVVDANFGILPRDVEIARHLASVARAHDRPTRVIFNSSKVHPERVEAISEILYAGGLRTHHTFSIQSLNPRVLELARRTGIEPDDYTRIQRRLNARSMSSMIELVWPMPGETLETFKDGVDELVRSGAQAFVIYPLLWLNNTGYRENTRRHGVVLLAEDDPAGNADLVVQTNDVSFEDYQRGLEFFMGSYFLHDSRGLYGTMQLLDALGVARFRDAIDAFGTFMSARSDGVLAELWNRSLANFEDMIRHNFRGMLSDVLLHRERVDFDRLLVAFAESQPSWFEGPHGELLRAAVDYDLLYRPYLFVQTPFELGAELRHLEVLESRRLHRRVRSPYDFPRLFSALRSGRALEAAALERGDFRITMDHRRSQTFLMPGRTEDQQQWLCTLAIQQAASIEPTCSVDGAAHERETVAG